MPAEVAAWRALVRINRSTDRPRIQTLLSQMTTLKLKFGESNRDYLTPTQMFELDLEEAWGKTSDKMFSAMAPKGLSAAYDKSI